MEQIEQVPFTLTAFFVLVGILIAGTGIIFFFSWLDQRRMKRKNEEKYPSATRKRKYPLIVDAKLDRDVTESIYD